MQGNLYKRFYGQGSGGYTAEHQLQGRVRRSEQGADVSGGQDQYVPKHKISITKDGPTEDEIFEAQIKAHSTSGVPDMQAESQAVPPQQTPAQPQPAPMPMQQPAYAQPAPVPPQQLQQPAMVQRPGLAQGTVPKPGIGQPDIPRPGLAQQQMMQSGYAPQPTPAVQSQPAPMPMQQPVQPQPAPMPMQQPEPMPVQQPMQPAYAQQPAQPQPAPMPMPQPEPMPVQQPMQPAYAQQPAQPQPAPMPMPQPEPMPVQQPMQPAYAQQTVQPAPAPAPVQSTPQSASQRDELMELIDEFRVKAGQLEVLINRKEQRAEALRQMIANGEMGIGQPGMVVSNVDTGEIVSQVNMQVSAIQSQMNQQLFAVSEELKASMAQISQSITQIPGGAEGAGIDPQQIESIVSEIGGIKANVDGLQEKLEGKIHSEGVASYRNIADLFKGLEENKSDTSELEKALTTKLDATKSSVRIATVISIVNLGLIAILTLFSMQIISIF